MVHESVIEPPESPPLDDGAVLGGWWREVEDGRIACELCPRACRLAAGDAGFCFVRENRGGRMVLATYGRSTGFCIDPIEKKPLHHFHPGTSVLSFGTAGCNLGCRFCQNWDISKSRETARLSDRADPAAIVAAARHWNCPSVAFTYNDPVIWAEYAIDAARACRAEGIHTVAVTAGYILPRPRETFFSWMDAANVDLKGFDEDFYFHYTSSHLAPVLDTLEYLARETDVWFEITNLVIPGANDDADGMRRMCDWIVDRLGDERPVHFSAFHPDFRLRDRPPTPLATLIRAYDIARAAGIKHVYVGNVSDFSRQTTSCPQCGAVLIARRGYEIAEYHVRGGRCARCDAPIAGRFDDRPGTWGARRQPVNMSDFAPSRPESDDPKRRGGGEAPELSAEQQSVVHRAASRVIIAELLGRKVRWPDPTLRGAAAMRVEGAFVTLKRSGDLRACCGTLGRTMQLDAAVRQAAARTASQDVRLPPIAISELPFLELDVTLLHRFRSLPAEPRARRGAIEIGRHGLHIRHGEQGGLLLPIVAVEHGLDAEGFLCQVCRKADLPLDAWQWPDTELRTFEGVVLEGPIPDELIAAGIAECPPACGHAEITRLSDFVRGNLLAHLSGATPTYYLPDLHDRTVAGVAVQVEVGSGDSRTWSRLLFRPGLPLQATLFELTAVAAESLRGSSRADPRGWNVSVAVLDEIAMHGTVAQSDLRGFDPRERALLLLEQNRSTWRFDPACRVDESVGRLVEAGQGRRPESARLFSLRIRTNARRIDAAQTPRPLAGSLSRAPAVAGAFYPADSGELDRMLDALIPEPTEAPRPWPAAMVPHAGLRYSGSIAARVLQRIEGSPTIVILGPKHTRNGVDWAVAPHDVWELPGRSVASDRRLAETLAARIQGLELDAAAHRAEHAIEVELPFIARFWPNSKVVGIAIGPCDYSEAESFADQLADVLRGMSPRPVLLISSDMNHFATDAENRRLDEMALAAMATLDPRALYDTVIDHGISMCGVLPAVIVMLALRKLDGLHTFERIAYGTSADTTGDRSRVVGYAGALLA
ncbi:MAG: AmmeMemoRadiSam system radical SAM enzyme [Planctomycetes bacterium]|nr:AmmeMemoRadiSam system radical SAM enzyme [Planctomycetota bacterium]